MPTALDEKLGKDGCVFLLSQCPGRYHTGIQSFLGNLVHETQNGCMLNFTTRLQTLQFGSLSIAPLELQFLISFCFAL